MWRTIHSLLVVFCAFCPAAALAGSIVGADGVLRYPYGERTPPTLICAPLFVCDLALESGETIVNVAVGDSVRWLISPASSGATNATTAHLLIKPVDVGLRTNLFVTTNRRAYELLLISRKDDPVLRVGFTYPQSVRQTFEAVRLQGERARALAASQHDATEKLDFDYRVEGDRRLQPVRVYNDGVHTYVQMPTALRELPVVFAVEAFHWAYVHR
jgi:type IV secretion system protein VirB9